MWGLVLSALTIAVSMVVGTKEEGATTTRSSSAGSSKTTSILIRNPYLMNLLKGDNQFFLSGAGTFVKFLFGYDSLNLFCFC
jgi:hypothetical protein